MKRAFLKSLMEDYDGLPDGWKIRRDSVKTNTIRTEQFDFALDSSKVQHQIFIETQMDKVVVSHSANSFEDQQEREFENPERAAVYVLGVSDALCEQERAEEHEEEEGLGELFG